jgi:nitroimidazol reductase NimA-like FMN-containing flavoprotein (pyridoxamine 5'-phosphate oxidase superfamily)
MTEDASAAPEAPLVPLDHDACARLLAATQFGRLAVIEAGKPMIVVLNHALNGKDIIFRTENDSRLAALTEGGQVIDAAYEVDSAFPAGRSGWSVVANGKLARETDPKRQQTGRARIRAWADGDRDVVFRLEVAELTGVHVGPI